MANDAYFSVIVNQKLAFAHSLLKLADREDDISNTQPARNEVATLDALVMQHALLDGVVAQLHSALLHYLAELAAHNGVSLPADSISLPLLTAAFEQSKTPVPHWNELRTILRQPNSSLNRLVAFFMQPQQLLESFKRDKKNNREDLNPALAIPDQIIRSVLISANTDPRPIEQLTQTARELQSLIDRQRAEFVEN